MDKNLVSLFSQTTNIPCYKYPAKRRSRYLLLNESMYITLCNVYISPLIWIVTPSSCQHSWSESLIQCSVVLIQTNWSTPHKTIRRVTIVRVRSAASCELVKSENPLRQEPSYKIAALVHFRLISRRYKPVFICKDTQHVLYLVMQHSIQITDRSVESFINIYIVSFTSLQPLTIIYVHEEFWCNSVMYNWLYICREVACSTNYKLISLVLVMKRKYNIWFTLFIRLSSCPPFNYTHNCLMWCILQDAIW